MTAGDHGQNLIIRFLPTMNMIGDLPWCLSVQPVRPVKLPNTTTNSLIITKS